MWIISGCLLGMPCKYDGGDNACEWVKTFAGQHDCIAVCPEVAGGLKSPRPPAEQVWMPVERKAADGDEDIEPAAIDGISLDAWDDIDEAGDEEEEQIRIIDREGRDVTTAFFLGAEASLQECLRGAEKRKFETLTLSPTENSDGIIEGAILKAHSPSCGSGEVYDGTFTHTLVPGDGVFAALLKAHGIPVYSEEDKDAFEGMY